jgi:hypothetical protein
MNQMLRGFENLKREIHNHLSLSKKLLQQSQL